MIEVVKKMCGNESLNIDDFNVMLTELKDLDKESLDLAARINDVYGDSDTCTKGPVKLPDRTKSPTNVPPTALVKPRLNSKFFKDPTNAPTPAAKQERRTARLRKSQRQSLSAIHRLNLA